MYVVFLFNYFAAHRDIQRILWSIRKWINTKKKKNEFVEPRVRHDVFC